MRRRGMSETEVYSKLYGDPLFVRHYRDRLLYTPRFKGFMWEQYDDHKSSELTTPVKEGGIKACRIKNG